VGDVCSELDDDAIAIQALHAKSLKLLPELKVRRLEHILANESCEGNHWLALYESVRHGFLKRPRGIVKSNQFFDALLKANVTFYQTKLPPYALLVHSGGAPPWVVGGWMKDRSTPGGIRPPAVGADVEKLASPASRSSSDILRALLGRLAKQSSGTAEPYS